MSNAKSTSGEEISEAKRAETFAAVKNMLESQDLYKAFDYVNSPGDPEQVGEHYSNLLNDFYWKDKNLYHVKAFGQAGIHYCLSQAEILRTQDSNRSVALKNQAKVIAFNLASCVWPGWNEPGIIISSEDCRLGLEAAKLNLRLATELGDDDLKMSNSYWMVGAQYLANQKYDEAAASFEKSREMAHRAGEKEYEFMAEGYLAITGIISGDKTGHDRLGEATRKLTEIGSDDALFFLDQFNTVLNTFIK
nr:hypothetical protein [candidate division Zixibacteria bacterium]